MSDEKFSVDLMSSKNTIDTAIRLGLLVLLVWSCLTIFKPFLAPVVWAIIIAVAVYPLYLKLERLLGGRKKLALVLFTVIALTLLIVPTVQLTSSLAASAQEIAHKVEAGEVHIPPPADKVAEWPLIGEKLHKLWSDASHNLTATLKAHHDQVKSFGKWLLASAASVGMGVLQFVISILIAAAFIANAKGGVKFAGELATRIVGHHGPEYASLAGATMRSVATGVLGIAVIQAVLAGLGMLVMDVPAAGIWALIVLLVAIMQLPPWLVMIPVAIYVFSVADTVPATIFLVYAIVVSFLDAVLKPLLLGRGVDIPMLIVLIGAIGGMIASGIVGLFTGAVVLSIGYKLFMIWLRREGPGDVADPEETAAS